MKRYIYTCIVLFLSFTLSLSVFTACSPDDLEAPGYVQEGEPATVSLKIDLDEISVRTRAAMSTDLESRVECLWVAIYNARTGERTFSKSYTPNGNFPEEPVLTTGEINDIETESGNSYIVAVANYQNKTAVDLSGKDGADKDTEQGLETLLTAADTWDKYRAIAIKQKSDGDYASIETPAEAIVMQGSYRAAEGHKENYTEDEGAETVGIQPGANNLDGMIHLRRIWTQNTFNIVPDSDVISMELVNVEVVNVPMLTWLYGRPQDNTDGTLGYANAGDAYDPVMPDDLKHSMYLESQTYTPTSMTVTTDDKGRPNYEFDYWQFENKRTGSAASYADREHEYKTDGMNSGIYTSLCGNSGKATLDNNATYIRFTARIRYIVDDIKSPGEIAGYIGSVKYRNAEATYVVHLGYIGNDASDFNCYRNSKYTYNIKVMSVDKILLEAFRKSENQPGAEGIVTDVSDEYFDLDAHFNVFNIYLTKDQLANFTFLMTTYEDNAPPTITNITDERLGVTANVPKKGDQNWKYYSWIQLVENGKSDKKTEIAEFPKLNSNGTEASGEKTVLYLNDISKMASKLADNEGYCFTVYVKEYTYEADYGETGYGDERTTEWTHYVNQPSRTASFKVAYSVSEDRESQHFKAKYALSQRSIQTYYDITKAVSGSTNNIEGTALGVEHINEVFGMNIRWTRSTPSGGYDADNGRYNVWRELGGSNNGNQATTAWEGTDVLTLTNLLQVNAATNTAQTQYATHLDFTGGKRYVPAMQTITRNTLQNNTNGYYNSRASSYDPQTSHYTAQYIQAIYSCMNRNKDENGDGTIDAAELKWYVPASGKYLRMILGRNNLVTPLMGYEQETLPEACGTGHNTLYHYISSDRKIVWTDEGISSSWFNDASQWQIAPWQVRCVRNLGTDLRSVSSGEKVKAAYDDTDVDETTKGGVIKPTRYFGGALRNPTTLPLPPHKTSSSYNRLAVYGFEIAPIGNGNTTKYDREAGRHVITYNNAGTEPQSVSDIAGTYSAIVQAIETASPCEKLNKSSGRKGWRIPNQKEIVIMMRAGVISQSGYYNYTLNESYRYGNSLSESGVGWGGTPGMMCCTQEHWPGIIADGLTNAGTTLSGTVNASDALSSRNRWTTIEPSSMLATAKNHVSILGVRCVRDLTVAEANMTYTQIKNHKTN